MSERQCIKSEAYGVTLEVCFCPKCALPVAPQSDQPAQGANPLEPTGIKWIDRDGSEHVWPCESHHGMIIYAPGTEPHVASAADNQGIMFHEVAAPAPQPVAPAQPTEAELYGGEERYDGPRGALMQIKKKSSPGANAEEVARKWVPSVKKVVPLIRAIVKGMIYDPGHSDLDDEQPIHVGMSLGDYRRARSLLWELEREQIGKAVECTVCRRTKKPRGRSAPIEMANSLCDYGCPGYDQSPEAGELWPGETREQFGY